MIRDVIFRNIGERFNIEVSNCEGVMIPPNATVLPRDGI